VSDILDTIETQRAIGRTDRRFAGCRRGWMEWWIYRSEGARRRNREESAFSMHKYNRD